MVDGRGFSGKESSNRYELSRNFLGIVSTLDHEAKLLWIVNLKSDAVGEWAELCSCNI